MSNIDVDPDAQAAALEGAGARKVARSTRHELTGDLEPPAKINDQSEYDALAPGKKYLDPEGGVRTKMHSVSNDADYDAVPEGASYVDPEGNVLTKAKFENVGFTAHTLYDMAVNDKERRNALERSYPGKVKQDHKGEFFVEEEDGTLRKPRGAFDQNAGPMQTAAALASGAAPFVGAVGGEIAGGGLGTLAAPGPGTIGGAVGGAAIGASLGQGVNDLVMKWAGVYDRSLGEEAGELALSGSFAGGGTAVGRGAAAAWPAVKSKLQSAGPKMAAKFLGAGAETVPGAGPNLEALETAIRLGEEGEHESSSSILRAWGMTDPGTASPTSAWAPEAPNLQLTTEVLHPAFFTQKPLQQSATAKMERGAGQILEDLGVKYEGKITDPTAAVSGREAGQKLLDRAARESSEAEAALQAKIAAQRAEAEAGLEGQVPGWESRMAELRNAGREADAAATKVVNAGYEEIEKDIENAMRSAKAGHNSGDFWGSVANRFKDLRQMLGVRASARYNGWTQAHGNLVPEQSGLAQSAQEFIDELPKAFQETRPTLVKKLAKLAGTKNEKGEWVQEATESDLAQLHDIRSLFRHHADWSDLAGDVQNGSMKRFANKLDEVIHGGKSNITKPTGIKLVHVPDEIEDIPGSNPKESYRSYTIMDETSGQPLGDIRAIQLPDGTLKVGWLKDQSEEGVLGNRMRSVMRQLQTEYPDAKAISGFRRTGANAGSEQTIPLERGSDPALKEAAKELDTIDAWYGKNIKIFNDKRVQAIVDGLENGQPADPKALVQLMVKENNTALNSKLRRMLGPNLWAGVKGAHADSLIRSNRTFEGTVNGTNFARDVLADHNSGLLESIHGKEGAAKIFRQAQNAAALDGTLDIRVRPGDTVLDVIGKAQAAQEAIKEEAAKNPIGLLKKEMTRIKQSEQQALKESRADRTKDPLKFLYNKTVGAAQAVDKILANEDLIITTEARFGRDSPEFEALRQTWAQRIFTGTLDPASRLEKVSPEVQSLMFNTSLEDAQRLAKDMTFLMGTRGADGAGAGQSMMAVSKITHPLTGGGPIGKTLGGVVKLIPGANPGGRAVLAGYYDLIKKFQESPSFQRWVMKGLKGDERSREIVREQVQKAMQRGGAIGAGVGEGAFQASGSTPQPEMAQ